MFDIIGPVLVGMYCCVGVEQKEVELVKLVAGLVMLFVLHNGGWG